MLARGLLTILQCILTGILLCLNGLFPIQVQADEAVNYLSFATNDEKNNIEIFKKASHSVVYVTNTALRRNLFSLNVYEIPQGTGSGFIWNNSGYIVTNYHVIHGADKVTVSLYDQTDWEAELIGVAPEKDIAVLKIKAPGKKLASLPLGNSAQLEVGRKVLAIGNPFGLDTTLTVGVVSALGREIESLTNRKIRDVIQTDAAINPGNSGGPLLNSMGQLIAINTQILSPSGGNIGIGFAIPVNTISKIVPQLIEHGRVIIPDIGVELANDNWAKRHNILGSPIIRVEKRSPARRVGIQGMKKDYYGNIILGDVIIAVDYEPVKNSDDYYGIMENHKPGDTVTITVQRDEEFLDFKVKLISQ